MKIFTLSAEHVTEGAKVEKFTLSSAGVAIPAILVGERGRGRWLGVLPVSLLPQSYQDWKEKGSTTVKYGEVGQTKAGKPKLFEKEEVGSDKEFVAVLLTPIGFRGSNAHTGDRVDDYWVRSSWHDDAAFAAAGIPVKDRYTEEEVEKYTPLYKAARATKWDEPFELRREFLPFPGKALVTGTIAQGAAGRAGSGSQGIAVIPANTVFRTGYGGRLYGAPSAHYYIYIDGQVLAATWEERQVSDIF